MTCETFENATPITCEINLQNKNALHPDTVSYYVSIPKPNEKEAPPLSEPEIIKTILART